MQLVRNMKTEVIHQPQCPHRGASQRWYYATTRTLESISADTRDYPWLHLCRACLPGSCQCARCSGDDAQ